MGLLDHLWDDTVAGPRPDNGLGKLRKHNTFSYRDTSGKGMQPNNIITYSITNQTGLSQLLFNCTSINSTIC